MKCTLNIVFFVTAFFSTASYAATISVTKFNDTNDGLCNSDCSLREAVVKADTTPEDDVIKLSSGTYVLDIPLSPGEEGELFDEDANANGDLDITGNVTIVGATDGTTIIDGANNDRIFDIIFGSTYLKNLTLTRGRQTEYGGAIENHSTLTLRDCVIKNNSSSAAFSPGAGGGIANWGTLNIYSSEISSNYAGAGEGHRGKGGGIYNAGNLMVRDSTFRANRASDDDDSGSGAGIYNSNRCIADIRRSLFTQHILSSNGYGAAIMNVGGIVKLVSSTISNNAAGEYGRGAIANGSPYDVGGKFMISNVTIADNSYFGLYSSGDTYIYNSIIAGNARPYDGLAQNCYHDGGKFDVRVLLMGQGENPNCASDYEIENNKTFTTLLDVLADNGGPTLTHALRKDSMAIDRSVGGYCPQTDQRGQSTNVDGNGDEVAVCDLGAVEYHP